jgi:hypothetical protein
MSAAQTLSVARAAGIHIEVEGDDLRLEAPAPSTRPPRLLWQAKCPTMSQPWPWARFERPGPATKGLPPLKRTSDS